MEAIKCPSCGSEKCQRINDELYVCQACDNEFLVHNLSKEFRATDEHISDMHSDLNERLDAIGKQINNTSVADNSLQIKEMLYEAETLIERKEYIPSAYEAYKKIAYLQPNSYIGYYGMFRAVTNDFKLSNYNINKLRGEEDNLYNGYSILKKAFECGDFDDNNALPAIAGYYKKNMNEIYEKYIDEKYGDVGAVNDNDIDMLSEGHMNDIADVQQRYQKYLQNKPAWHMTHWLPFGIISLILLILDVNIVLKVIFIIGILFGAFVIYSLIPRESEEIDFLNNLYNQDMQRINEKRAVLSEKEAYNNMSDLEIKNIIYSNCMNGISTEEWYNKQKSIYDDFMNKYGNIEDGKYLVDIYCGVPDEHIKQEIDKIWNLYFNERKELSSIGSLWLKKENVSRNLAYMVYRDIDIYVGPQCRVDIKRCYN